MHVGGTCGCWGGGGGGEGSVHFSCAVLVQTALAALRPMGSFLRWLVFRRGFRTQFPPLGFSAMASGFLMAPVRGWGRGGGGGAGRVAAENEYPSSVQCSCAPPFANTS